MADNGLDREASREEKGEIVCACGTRDLGSAKRRGQQTGETGLDEGQAGQQTTGETTRRADDEMDEGNGGRGPDWASVVPCLWPVTFFQLHVDVEARGRGVERWSWGTPGNS